MAWRAVYARLPQAAVEALAVVAERCFPREVFAAPVPLFSCMATSTTSGGAMRGSGSTGFRYALGPAEGTALHLVESLVAAGRERGARVANPDPGPRRLGVSYAVADRPRLDHLPGINLEDRR